MRWHFLMAEYGAIGSAAQVRYLTVDAPGWTRLETDGAGAVTSRHDYAPFGSELTSASNAVRSAANGFVGQELGVRQEFTGKERDSETRLDNFGARYCASGMNRFMTPDAPFADQSVEDPQSWHIGGQGVD